MSEPKLAVDDSPSGIMSQDVNEPLPSEDRIAHFIARAFMLGSAAAAVATEPKPVRPSACPSCYRQDGKHNSRCKR